MPVGMALAWARLPMDGGAEGEMAAEVWRRGAQPGGAVAPACLDVASDAALVARMLDGGDQGSLRGRALLRAHGGWWGLRRALAGRGAVAGLRPLERARLLAALEIGRRGLVERVGRSVLNSPERVVARHRDLALCETEVLVALGLDAGRRLVCEHRMVGAVDGVQALPRDLLRPLIAAGATALIVLHNHPSGSCEPSQADRVFTRRLSRAAGVCGLPLLDHLIIAGGGWHSLAAEGELEDDAA